MPICQNVSFMSLIVLDTYMAEFMIESNATLYVSGALSAIKQKATPNTTMTIELLELTAGTVSLFLPNMVS